MMKMKILTKVRQKTKEKIRIRDFNLKKELLKQIPEHWDKVKTVESGKKVKTAESGWEVIRWKNK